MARMDQVEPQINACPIRCETRARTAAKDIAVDDPHIGHLAGMPIAIKDLSAVAGVRSTWGTQGLSDFVPDVSDPVVTRLEARGGVVLAKTNTPEFGAGANTFNDVFGPTLNPWNTDKNAAGSSGGAAAALATGEFWLAHGSDHAGSLRTPAAYCRVVGLRTSPGRVPAASVVGFAREGVQGPMARNVMDCALFLDAMSGFDPKVPLSYPAPDTPFSTVAAKTDIAPRIAYAPTLGGYGPVEVEIRDVLDAAIAKVAKDGANIEDACPDITDLERSYRILRGGLWAATVGRMDAKVQDHIKDTLKDNIAFGQALTVSDMGDAALGRSRIFDTMATFFESYDILATTVVGCAPKDQSIEYPTEIAGEPMDDYISWLKFAFLATTTGLPAISVPVGFTAEGLPVGLQLIGPHRAEAKLLQVAHFVEASLGLDLGPIDPMGPPKS